VASIQRLLGYLGKPTQAPRIAEAGCKGGQHCSSAGRDDTAGHGVGDGGQRPHQIGGADDRRQVDPNTPTAARRRDAIKYYLGRRHIASLGGVDYRTNHGLGITGHHLLGETGSAGPGAGWLARRAELAMQPSVNAGLVIAESGFSGI